MKIAMQRILIVDGFKRKEREKIHIEHPENAMQKTKRERYLGTNGRKHVERVSNFMKMNRYPFSFVPLWTQAENQNSLDISFFNPYN